VIVNLHIERLVVEGLAIEPGEGPLLSAVVRAELMRLLATEGAWHGLAAGGDREARVPRATMTTGADGVSGLGFRIARSIHRGISE
jgi:hypothetical protein